MSFWKKHRKLHIWLAVDLAVLGLYLALRQNRQLMNSFADHVTTPLKACLLYTSPSPRDVEESRMPSSA